MKKTITSLFALLLVATVMFQGCQKEGFYTIPTTTTVSGIDVTIPRIVYDNGTIMMFISVTDLAGRPVSGLGTGNMTIETIQDGNTTEVSGVKLYSTGGTPTTIAAAMTMDYSGSMYYDTAFVPAMENAIKTFVGMKSTVDKMEIIKFDHDVKVIQPFTTSTSLLNAAVDDTTYYFHGSTAFYRSCLVGLHDADSAVFHVPSILPAVIGFTDGVNNQAPLDPDTVINAALQLQIPVYAIGFGGTASYPPDTTTLRHIADTTGGRFYYSPDTTSLTQLYQYVNGQLGSTLLVGFPFGNKANATIRVTVNYLGFVDKAEKMIWY